VKLAVDPELTHAAGDDVAVLGAKVKDGDLVVRRLVGVLCRHGGDGFCARGNLPPTRATVGKKSSALRAR
jgi:hypothetical protein